VRYGTIANNTCAASTSGKSKRTNNPVRTRIEVPSQHRLDRYSVDDGTLDPDAGRESENREIGSEKLAKSPPFLEDDRDTGIWKRKKVALDSDPGG
jgi:hypothetical protein